MKAALIVAHPDDESLWFAGYVLSHPYDWTVYCCSIPRHDPIRAWKFYDACQVLGARGLVLPFTESDPGQPLEGLDNLKLEPYDHILTHGSRPEPGYGRHHVHHAHVHAHVKDKWGHKKPRFLGAGEDFYLSASALGQKLSALRCYNHRLPHNGRIITKWEALFERYCEGGGYDLGHEAYDHAVA